MDEGFCYKWQLWSQINSLSTSEQRERASAHCSELRPWVPASLITTLKFHRKQIVS